VSARRTTPLRSESLSIVSGRFQDRCAHLLDELRDLAKKTLPANRSQAKEYVREFLAEGSGKLATFIDSFYTGMLDNHLQEAAGGQKELELLSRQMLKKDSRDIKAQLEKRKFRIDDVQTVALLSSKPLDRVSFSLSFCGRLIIEYTVVFWTNRTSVEYHVHHLAHSEASQEDPPTRWGICLRRTGME
jgi:hypothetical protein